MTVEDLTAFDVSLEIVISKNGIEILEETIIGSDYSYDDDQTPQGFLNYLISDYGSPFEHIETAKETLKKLVN